MVDSGEVSGAADGALSTEDKQLLSLLLAGLTDEAIAAHFRISVRTVQRKVHALMEMASVRTRMQLAWEAARQDWLPGAGGKPVAGSAATVAGVRRQAAQGGQRRVAAPAAAVIVHRSG